ncbi:MAG: phosphoribosylanthranilate isomerase [Deltaproteobacteria bacterium]|nr:phosphoribosylanthranilate isomerase [Deltaproteobacteria bacterium]
MVRVKFCGITNDRDAMLAVTLGVDALGFVFAPSSRRVSPEVARRIIQGLPPFVQTVGVFVNENPVRVEEIVRFCGLDMVQLHGDEPPDLCKTLMPRTIKAFRLKGEPDLQSLESYRGKVRAFLFDTYVEDRRGGTGKTFDWGLALSGKEMGVPVILAGGLNPGNVCEAVTVVRPYAVDVGSGIEESPGKKSFFLMKKLLQRMREIHSGNAEEE